MAYQEVAAELLTMAAADQKMRWDAMTDPQRWDTALDREHTQRLRNIVERLGWLTIEMVGAEASNAAWILAQHADHDPEFQMHCLGLMRALPKGAVRPANIAYLEDRVLVAQGLPQLYGTQFEGAGGSLRPRAIADLDELDARRADMGLEPFADYLQQMHEIYGATDSAEKS